ncbi:MAG: phosphoglucomutase/phosphomannomutase family protein [Tychonema bourrellyi B0820]|uniref:phosphoglucomutase (alpha-D-glucose-1,6-bisphosphate-dependent) n=1 Tax=Tychonema bourrellyi FEM_GT703 TaxID=2040638 RepID=A0A2G4F189_9CYAN|nr:phosphoglucomutase/phosphomannomutase family protein [Tychonema bourrellyi]MDQ2099498.1 phosphoglucomutase/phosphomannomutase family protein [Tychonema bourrellyi B0820]PHX55531.1 phosphoglucosamine mutase [Tychonema bourrellyi FEM_GT703]
MNPIKFGTDGWRGIIADDFTFDRVALVAPLAAQVLGQTGGNDATSGTVIVGYDRRFLAEDFALTAAKAVQNAGFDVLLSDSYAPTPAFSLAAKQLNALGAIVLTASHNPGAYLGLKVKGGFGGSVSPEVTQQIEAKLENPAPISATPGKLESFNPWPPYCKTLREMVDIDAIKSAIASHKITVFVDVMHGAAAGGLAQILEETVHEVNSDRDPLFGGGAPEPLPRYLSQLFRVMRTHQRKSSGLSIGFVFDGDSDRIAAVDSSGNFLSSQILVPILIEHLAKRRGLSGEVIKTVSGSDIMPKIAELYGLPLFETPIGYKYIADRMLTTQVLVGGEESGGIGYGTHIPERDALLSALYLLEAVVKSGEDLSDIYRRLQTETGFTSAYDRIDLHLANMDERSRLLDLLQNQPLTEIACKAVVDCNKVDGYKFRLADGSWLLIRFSGTEPVLRLYSEAATLKEVMQNLNWAKSWAQKG